MFHFWVKQKRQIYDMYNYNTNYILDRHRDSYRTLVFEHAPTIGIIMKHTISNIVLTLTLAATVSCQIYYTYMPLGKNSLCYYIKDNGIH